MKKRIIELAREEVKDLTPCVHGGDVWRAAERRRVEAKEILDFSANVNPLGPSKKVVEKIRESLWQTPYYPDPDYTRLREAISRYIGGIKRDNVIVGNGSTELIYLFCEVFMERGDSALIPAPTFGEYEKAVKRAGGKPVYVNLGRDFRIDVKTFIERAAPPIKAIFLCNPNNPTGILAPQDDVLRIVEEASRRNVLVFVDEAFIEFVDGEKRYSLAEEVKNYQNLFVLRSLTKAFGLAGLRVGYGIACEDVINILSKAKVPWNVNCLAQVAAISALEDQEHMKRTQKLISEERKFLLSELEKIGGLKVFPTDTNFIFIDVRQSGLTAPQLKERMLLHGILLRDCSSFIGLDEHYVRVSVRTRRDNEKLLASLKEVIGVSGSRRSLGGFE
ncbi:MAG: threonine-phosphate decarboxylase CobD [Candidatus Freyarchaeota archaeon]